jgi:hypothetical protein
VTRVWYRYDGEGALIEERANPHSAEGSRGNQSLTMKLLEACRVWIAGNLGPKREIEAPGATSR